MHIAYLYVGGNRPPSERIDSRSRLVSTFQHPIRTVESSSALSSVRSSLDARLRHTLRLVYDARLRHSIESRVGHTRVSRVLEFP